MLHTETEQRIFDALCDVLIYMQTDCLRPKKTGKAKFEKSVRLLEVAKLVDWDSEDDARSDVDAAADRYNEMVEEIAAELMPSDYTPTHDYWGGKNITNNGHGNKDTDYTFGGDGNGLYSMFDNYVALKEYGNEAAEFHCNTA